MKRRLRGHHTFLLSSHLINLVLLNFMDKRCLGFKSVISVLSRVKLSNLLVYFMCGFFSISASLRIIVIQGPELINYDGETMLDVSGSYGVNVVGYEGYKGFVDRGWARVRDLGANVLGPVHPAILDVIRPLREITGLDEVSFHMSGTEAVMAAVRLARFNTRRKLVVTFGGAYHGWWDGMQPGAGNERFTSDVLSIKDMSPASMRLIRARASEIAAVLVSPLQGLNPNKPPPSDLVLLDAKVSVIMKGGSRRREEVFDMLVS